ncbi:MAG: MerR family transcriptional regulator [candidate division Zixibacteria bacterium]|nr:MerR family transcriptional regulator [candidate division Zixibacteria bacterium]
MANIEIESVPIGVAADALGVHPRTLRLYEQAGLVEPSRRRGRRYYSAADLAWLRCLRDIVHGAKISLPALVRLLNYEGCWEIRGCSAEERKACPARRGPGPCWERIRACCRRGREVCRTCRFRKEYRT